MSFVHPYSTGARRRTVKERGGVLKDVLTITATIALQESDYRYDVEKENELVGAAVEYAKNKPIDVIEFEQGQIDA